MLPNSAWVQLASTTKPWVHINLPKKTGYDSSYLATLKAWTNFVCAGLSFLHSSSLISRPDKIYQVSWLHTFYQYMFSQQTQIGIQIYSLCTLFDKCSSSSSLTSEKGGLRTWKLEQILRLSHGWLISNPVDDYFEYLIAKKISKSKIKASPVNEAGLYMAFKHSISYATYLDWKWCQRWFPSFSAPSSEVAVLFCLNPGLPFLSQVFDLDLLLCTGFYMERVD